MRFDCKDQCSKSAEDCLAVHGTMLVLTRLLFASQDIGCIVQMHMNLAQADSLLQDTRWLPAFRLESTVLSSNPAPPMAAPFDKQPALDPLDPAHSDFQSLFLTKRHQLLAADPAKVSNTGLHPARWSSWCARALQVLVSSQTKVQSPF